MRNSSCGKITIAAQWFIFYALVLLLVPIRWVLGWSLASLLHEFGHCIALKLCNVRIVEIRINIHGAQITAEPIPQAKEAICALAGPAVGLCTLLVLRYAPYMALSGFIQSCFNLLPVYPLDGGRALRCFLLCYFNTHKTDLILQLISITMILGFVAFGIWMSIKYALGAWPILFPAMSILGVMWKNSLQR